MAGTLLYLLRRPPDEALRRVLEAHAAQGRVVRLLLCQDAVAWAGAPPGIAAAHVREDAERRGTAGAGQPLGWGEALEWIHQADVAIVW